jgi:3-oxoacyl-[acyl-carrier-protein] synthase II
MKRVVVTGMGAVTPVGNSLDEILYAFQNGISGAGPITRFDAAQFKTRFACEVKNFDPGQFMDAKEARRMDLYTQFGMAAAEMARAHANLDPELVDKTRVGVIWGSGIGGLNSLEAEIESFAKGSGVPRYNPFMIPKMISNIASGMISMRYGFMGVNYATVSACATSAHAIINAMDYIRMGRADVFICGGSEAAVLHAGIGGFNSMKAMSERNDDYATASRPYDKDRDGFVLAEGGAALILESYEHATKRGATILAEIVGGGMSADAYHMTAPHPDGLGAKLAMKWALEDAKINESQIDYINTHGTSTPLGDIAELRAIQALFGDHAYKMNISSTKSMTGHLLGAAGAIEALAGILAIQNNFIPPTINHFTDDPEIDSKLNLTFNVPQERKVDIMMSNGFGFGGHNTTLIFKKFSS